MESAWSNDPGGSGSTPDRRADRLYFVTRADLAPGLQAAQVAHVALQLARNQPALAELETVVVLAARDEAALAAVLAAAQVAHYPVEAFCEPDLGGQLTAVALGPQARALVSSLPLALRRPSASRRADAGHP